MNGGLRELETEEGRRRHGEREGREIERARARVEYFGPGMNYGSQGLPPIFPPLSPSPTLLHILSLKRDTVTSSGEGNDCYVEGGRRKGWMDGTG